MRLKFLLNSDRSLIVTFNSLGDEAAKHKNPDAYAFLSRTKDGKTFIDNSRMTSNDNTRYIADQNRPNNRVEEGPEHLLFSQYVEDELPGVEDELDLLPDCSKTSYLTYNKYSDLEDSIRLGRFNLPNPIPKTPLLIPDGAIHTSNVQETPLLISGGSRTVIQETPFLIPGGATAVQKTPLLLSDRSPFIGNKRNSENNRNNLQVVPQTPFLEGGGNDSPTISGLVHRKNSGFQVPETPMVLLGRQRENMTTVVKETPLLPKFG